MSADAFEFWCMVYSSLWSPQLVRSDREQTVIAQLHRNVQPPPPDLEDAFLEIAPEGSYIFDHILVSFIFVEKEIQNRDKSPRRSPDPLPNHK